jgi:hypothetical protein
MIPSAGTFANLIAYCLSLQAIINIPKNNIGKAFLFISALQ